MTSTRTSLVLALGLTLGARATAGEEPAPKLPAPSFHAERSGSGVTVLRFDEMRVQGRVRHPVLLFVTAAPAPRTLRLVRLRTDFADRIATDPDEPLDAGPGGSSAASRAGGAR